MKRYSLRFLVAGLFGVFALISLAVAQTSNYLPVPSNVFLAKGAVAVAQDGNNLTGVAPSTAGGLLTSQGAGALPTFATIVKQYTALVTPTAVSAGACSDQDATVTGLLAADYTFVNLAYVNTSTVTALVASRASTGANTVVLTWCNMSNTSRTPSGGSIRVNAIRT